MSTVASPPAVRPAPPPPVRTGRCRWSVWIEPAGHHGGTHYHVIPMPAPPDHKGVWRIRKQGTDAAYTVAAPKKGGPGCTCPDHETHGTVCKHIRALGALGLLKLPKPKPQPKRRPMSARGAREQLEEARQLSP